jgi:hypothetical protein
MTDLASGVLHKHSDLASAEGGYDDPLGNHAALVTGVFLMRPLPRGLFFAYKERS